MAVPDVESDLTPLVLGVPAHAHDLQTLGISSVTPMTMFWIRDRVVPHWARDTLSEDAVSLIEHTIEPSSLRTSMTGCQS